MATASLKILDESITYRALMQSNPYNNRNCCKDIGDI